ncbi:MAG: type II secretion system protein [Patescibacteria group bacterium]
MKLYKQGFTIIELLVVIAIIGILATIIVANVSGSKSKSRDSRRVADVKEIQLALEVYYNDNGKYPLKVTNLVPNYLPQEPRDPVALVGYYYSTMKPPSFVGNCSQLAAPIIKYHLGAAMENKQGVFAGLKQDHDWSGAANSGGVFVDCGSILSGPDFHGNTATGGTPCVGTTGSSDPNNADDQCYDVTN